MNVFSIRTFRFHRMMWLLIAAVALCTGIPSSAQAKNDAKGDSDVLVLNNGDTLHGKFVKVIDGKVTFHTDAFGDMTLGWDKIKELHTSEKYAVLSDQEKAPSKKVARHLPTGTFAVENQAVTAADGKRNG